MTRRHEESKKYYASIPGLCLGYTTVPVPPERTVGLIRGENVSPKVLMLSSSSLFLSLSDEFLNAKKKQVRDAPLFNEGRLRTSPPPHYKKMLGYSIVLRA